MDLANFFGTHILLYGHRGAKKYEPENTVAAFKGAIKDGCDGVELDVHLTADGALAVIHDKSLDRTTDHTGLITDLTQEQLHTINAAALWPGRQEPIPTLDEVVESLPNHAIINIEIKDYKFLASPKTERAVVDAIHTLDLKSRVVVSSFYPLVLQRIKRLDPNIPTALIWEYTDWRHWLVLLFLLLARPDILHPCHLAIYPWTRWLARVKGVVMQVWVVNEPESMVQLSHDPLIKGIMSDDTRLLTETLTNH